MKIQHFTDLKAWQEGYALVLDIYKVTDYFPPEEKFSLTSQIRRCAVSITSNLSEGFGRQGKNDKLQFYAIARGSVLELQNQLLIARDIKILNVDDFPHLSQQSVLVHTDKEHQRCSLNPFYVLLFTFCEPKIGGFDV